MKQRKMKLLKSVFVLTAITLVLTTQAQGINFEQGMSWAQVKEKAAKEHKYIFVDCFTTWCAPCRAMDQQIYPATEAGKAFNKRFISVRLQMDKTSKDDEQVRSQYEDAKMIEGYYGVNAYPTLLFFDPEGKLVSRKIGGIDVNGLVALAKDAQDPAKQLANVYQLYRKKKLSLNEYPYLADKAEQLGKYGLADSARLAYKRQYLDKLPMEKLLTKENLYFLYRNTRLIHSKDRYFEICQHQPSILDNLLPGASTSIVKDVLVRECIKDKLPKNTPVDWTRLEQDFLNAYKADDALDVFLLNKVEYYISTGNLDAFADAVDELISRSPDMLSNGFRLAGLNNFAWYIIFPKTDDPKLLERAVRWMNIVTAINPSHDNIDTKANLLYKLGKIKLAIIIEQSIINRLMIDQPGKSEKEAGGDFYLTLQKMKKGEPTWIEIK